MRRHRGAAGLELEMRPPGIQYLHLKGPLKFYLFDFVLAAVLYLKPRNFGATNNRIFLESCQHLVTELCIQIRPKPSY